MPSPFSDFLDFLLGNTDDHDALGSWKYLFVVLFFALVFTSVVVAWKNWREDPSQRTGRNLAIWFVLAAPFSRRSCEKRCGAETAAYDETD